ncbi:putative glycosyltransferase [Streptococcus pneumoniae]|uniref:glycosyltransferase family 2 protein n=3 Tax=Staphylococcus warneri TaxID=1292 RepID=UPI0005DC9218|nr:glycosyltransferase family 2 protein [Staphylococcus warneri]COS01071.1 putative glycosyltransferase [Streptococcus pneumoniae]KTW06383.1 glycosyl transferase [Staphylococcus warneri]KTW25129.1 glycosyl transferase [Staphylococcus warneri]MCK6089555.1 glycosyltransferase family 2 protein [Staphylococcus warneri]MCK6245361.1 glycosyltransferase family 2 protein [Staphylococcus warneri]
MKVIAEHQISKDIEVSLLISTYNKSKFIKSTLNSLLKQTFDKNKFELIVVDDCSTDDTLEIVNKIIPNFSNYKLIQLNVNSGTPAKPRNLSIDLSKGDFLMFVDGDDWLPEDAVEKLYNMLKLNKTDYSTGLTKYMHSNKISRAGVALSKIEQNKLDINNVRKSFYHLAPAGKMIKAEIIKNNNIRFPAMIFGEDLQFFAEVLFHVDKISTTQDVVYIANRYKDNVSLVRSNESTMNNRINFQMQAYENLVDKYKNNPLFEKLLIRLINRDFLSAKFYTYNFIREIDIILPTIHKAIKTIEKDVDINPLLDDELNQKAVELIKKNNKRKIIKFIEWYLIKDSKNLHFKKNIAYYKYKCRYYKKPMHVILQKISKKDGNTILHLFSKNSSINFIEVKNRKDPTQYHLLNIKKNALKPGEYLVKFNTGNIPKGKVSLIVLDKDLNSSVIKTENQAESQPGFYKTINNNLGFIK